MVTVWQSTQAANGNGQKTKRPHGNNTGLQQAYDFRDIAAKEAKSLMECECTTLEEKVTRARALKDCNSVWYAASERIRIIKGKPMPGSLRPVKAPKKVRAVSTKPLEQLPVTTTTVVDAQTDSTSVRTEPEQSMLKESLVRTEPSPPSVPDDPAGTG